MDTYEALLASMDYLVKPASRPGALVSKEAVQPAKALSEEIGSRQFEEVTPENWIQNPLNKSK